MAGILLFYVTTKIEL